MSGKDRHEKVGFVFVPDPDLRKKSRDQTLSNAVLKGKDVDVIVISDEESIIECGLSDGQLSEDEFPSMIRFSPIRSKDRLGQDESQDRDSDDDSSDYKRSKDRSGQDERQDRDSDDDSSDYKRSKDRSSQDERQDRDSDDDSSDYKRYDGEWYNTERKTPVFKWSGKRFQEGNKLCKYLLEPAEPDRIATAVPQNVAHNTTFLLDVKKLSHRDDWKSDDMGVWRHNGKYNSTFALLKGGFIEVGDSFSPSKKIATYKLFKRYYKNKSNQAVRKCVSWLEGNPDLICIQYVFQDGEIALKSLPHGNAKHDNQAYVRIKESTKVKLSEKSAVHTPKMAYQKVNEEMGGIVRAASISDLPRGKEQARYLKRKHSDNSNKIDSLVVMLEKCKRQQLSRHEELYIQEVIGAPELRSVLCFKWQLEEIILFCTNPRKFTILGADPTFNLGRFNLTVTTYQNLKVVDKKTGQHPIMIGPVFMSQTKSYDAYHYFFSKMVGLSHDCAHIMVFGTDGEEQLSKAMQRAFPRAIHLRCFNHFRENCIAKLRKSNVPDAEIKLFLNDIFSRRIGNVFEEGLLDSFSEEDLKVKAMSLEETWHEREKKYLPSKQQPSFYAYFVERIEMMSANMLKEVRVNAGLGDPPSQYFTNIPESANALIKRAVSFKESEMAAFCSKMEEIVRHQRSDSDNAVINKGPYKLAATHQNFQITTDRWFRMNTRQRELHLKKFHESAVVPEESKKTRPDSSHAVANATSNALSIAVMDAGISNIPPMSLENMYRKAEEMLSRPNAIIRAPGCDENSFMVESSTNNHPHFVTHDTKTNKVTCNDCPAWMSFKICSHTLAVAEKIGKLRSFFLWHAKMAPPANLTSLVTSDSGKGVGKKGNKSATSRRRGGRYNEPSSTIAHIPMGQGKTTSSTNTHPPLNQAAPGDQSSAVLQSSAAHQPSAVLQSSAAHQTAPAHQSSAAHQPSAVLQSSAAHQPSAVLQSSAAHQTAPAHQSSAAHHTLFHQVAPVHHATSVHQATSLHHTAASQRKAPVPASGVFELHLLQNCPSQVSTCFGCGQSLKPGGGIGIPPYDLVIVSRMPRQFVDHYGNRQSREGNVYFHALPACVRLKQPYFGGGLRIPLNTEMDLQSEHEDLLSREFGITFDGL